MSVTSIHLRKLLCLMYAPANLRTAILRDDIRMELKKEGGFIGEGGDFHCPFWADAKSHVLGEADLNDLVASRVFRNKGRKRLYEALATGFLDWWNDKRRWRNEPLFLLPTPAKARLAIPEVAGVI